MSANRSGYVNPVVHLQPYMLTYTSKPGPQEFIKYQATLESGMVPQCSENGPTLLFLMLINHNLLWFTIPERPLFFFLKENKQGGYLPGLVKCQIRTQNMIQKKSTFSRTQADRN